MPDPSSGLRLGVAAADITPDHPLTMVGFGQTRPFEAVSRPIKARVLVFERAGRRAAIVTADLLRWSSEIVEELRSRLEDAIGVPPERLLMHATHTHCAPQVSSRFVPVQAAADEEYCEQLRERVLSAARCAADDLEPVRVGLGRGSCEFSVNRRLRRNGAIAMAPNPDGPNDPTVTVATFRRAFARCDGGDEARSGTVKALLVHYTCHPTTSAQNRISPDYPGAAMDLLEHELGEGVVAGFLQGCCGDIRPALVEDGRFRRGTQADVDRLAAELAGVVSDIMAGDNQALGEAPVEGWRDRVELPYSRLPSDEELRRQLDRPDAPDVDGRWARRMLATSDWHAGHAELEVSLLRLADGLALLALNAEAVVSYGAAIRALGGDKVLPLGYSNGMLGYLPTADQLAEGGYEAVQSTRFYCLPAPLGPDTEALTLGAIRGVLTKARRSPAATPA